jgi:hypothetical protein
VIARTLADAVALLHLAFIVFVVLGGFLVLRWPRLAWLHLPCALWGALIEFFSWPCPLTPLEQWLRAQGGERSYTEGFIDHYVWPLVYPPGLTPAMQTALGLAVVAINMAVYASLRRRKRRATSQAETR